VGAVEAGLGPVDILISNAGLTRDGLLLRMKDEDWETVMAVNLTAYFRLAKTAMKGMIRRRSGRIIGIASVVGVMGNAGQANYAASKAGMIGFTKSLAQEVASRNVTANVVAPGFISSPMTDALNEQQKAKMFERIPAGRFGEGADVAAAVVYLASDAAGYVTGQTLHVNGGMHMV
jgi:3-oxoacyl-[acyl-carrier protein] reductase